MFRVFRREILSHGGVCFCFKLHFGNGSIFKGKMNILIRETYQNLI